MMVADNATHLHKRSVKIIILMLQKAHVQLSCILLHDFSLDVLTLSTTKCKLSSLCSVHMHIVVWTQIFPSCVIDFVLFAPTMFKRQKMSVS